MPKTPMKKRIKPIRLTPEKWDYIILKTQSLLGISFQKYADSILFPSGWERDYAQLKRKAKPIVT